MKLQISCKEAVDHIHKLEENKLSLGGRIQLKYHLMICSLCKRFNIQNKYFTTLFRDAAHQETHFSTDEKTKMIETLAKTID